MNPHVNAEELRTKIVQELNLGHLSPQEQDAIIGQLGDVLMERATMTLLSKLPSQEVEKVDQLLAGNMHQEAQALIEKYVPNTQEVIAQAVHEGIEEHKRRVNEAMAEQGGSAQ